MSEYKKASSTPKKKINETNILDKMKIRFLKLKDWLLMTAMGLFGLTACHTAKETAQNPPAKECDTPTEAPSPRNEMALMYGVPTMDFVIKGRVINEQGKPVKGMQVILVNQTIDIAPDHMDEDNPYVQEYIQRPLAAISHRHGYNLFRCIAGGADHLLKTGGDLRGRKSELINASIKFSESNETNTIDTHTGGVRTQCRGCNR